MASVDEMLQMALDMGTRDGASAASWVEFDGPRAAAEWIADTCHGPEYGPLSGQWGDGLLVRDLVRSVGGEYDSHTWPDWLTDYICQNYEESWYDAWLDNVEVAAARIAVNYTPVGPDLLALFDGADRFTVGTNKSMAYYVVGWWDDDKSSGNVSAMMVGDDQEYCVALSDLVPIADPDYCVECGQVGCTGDFRTRD